jgi:Tol biopolymer transport system component
MKAKLIIHDLPAGGFDRMTRARSTVAVAAALAMALATAPAQAAFPGGNGRLVFQRPVGKQVDLFTVPAGGGAIARLTRTAAWEEKAEWSPDGAWVVFGRSRPSGEPTEIATLNALTGEQEVLTRLGSSSQAPTWSPDGRIAFFSLFGAPKPASRDMPPPAELYAMIADGAGQQRLTRDREIQTDPEWSPDGTTIAYSQWRAVRGEPGVFDIALSLMNHDGGNQRPLLRASSRRDVTTQSWSPDGKQLVVEWVSARPSGRKRGDRQSDIAVINADGSGLRFLTRTPALETEPVWSPDGTRIAFASDRHVKRGRGLDRNGSAFEIYTMRVDGGDVRRLTRNRVPDLYPDWQPLPASPAR